MEQMDEPALANGSIEFLSWSIFDPRAAFARLERVPVNPKLCLNGDYVREQVSDSLRSPHEARWREVWGNFTEMADMIHPDLY